MWEGNIVEWYHSYFQAKRENFVLNSSNVTFRKNKYKTFPNYFQAIKSYEYLSLDGSVLPLKIEQIVEHNFELLHL